VGAHDALFKHVFRVPEHAAAVLAHVLPPGVSAQIAWSTLRLEPGSFVDPTLAARHTDLLFSAQVAGQRALVYLLFEHQSWPPERMPLRMAGYVVKILEAECARTSDTAPLPVVIPVVLHHHAGGWTTARSMSELYGADPVLLDAIGDQTLALRIAIDDLGVQPASMIAARVAPPLVRLVLGVLRDSREMSIQAVIHRWGALMIETARTLGHEALAAVLSYLVEVHEIDDRALLLAAREHGGVELEEVVMHATNRWWAGGKAEGIAEGKAEGKAEGVAEGKAAGKAELLLRQLHLRFGDLAPSVVDRVRTATSDQLDTMAERILTAKAATDVLG
jgi:predicted transposase/invertase (TIGR01784 family)